MLFNFFKKLEVKIDELWAILKTREFWIYSAVICVLLLMAIGIVRLATGFDPLTRAQMSLDFSCNTSEGRLGTIIVGGFVFVLLSLFTLGEVVSWVEETRSAKAPGREYVKVNYWRPIVHVLSTLALGASGYFMLLSWCS